MDRLTVMKMFVRVVETGSFSAAARYLNVGQPAVSKSVAQLEERLGVCLVMRSTHGLTPTDAGRNFCERARRALEEVEEADRAARGSDADLSGRLRIGAGTSFGKLHLIPLLPFFFKAHPDLSIDLLLEDRPIDLIEHGIDLGLRFGPLPSSSLVVRRIGTGRRRVFASPLYLERMGAPAAPTDLSRHTTVIYTEDRAGTDSWNFRLGAVEMSVPVSGRLCVSSSEGMRTAVVRGIGLAVAPQWMFESEISHGAVRIVLDEWRLPDSDLWAIFPTGRMVSAKARAFFVFIEEELRKTIFSSVISGNELPILALNRGMKRNSRPDTEVIQGIDEIAQCCTEAVTRQRRSGSAG